MFKISNRNVVWDGVHPGDRAGNGRFLQGDIVRGLCEHFCRHSRGWERRIGAKFRQSEHRSQRQHERANDQAHAGRGL